MKQQLWMLVGGNGAGKTTFYNLALKPLGMPFINADIIAKEVFPDEPEARSYEAAMIAEKMRTELLHKGTSFCFETVFSHPSKIDFIGKAKSMGYEIILVVIHIASSMLNHARIAQRVNEGGHSVAKDKVEKRIPRTLNNIAAAIPLCDQVRVFDNTSLENPFKPVLTIKHGIKTVHVTALPQWAERF